MAELQNRNSQAQIKTQRHAQFEAHSVSLNAAGIAPLQESKEQTAARRAMMIRAKSMHKWTDDAVVEAQKEMKQAMVHLVKTQLKKEESMSKLSGGASSKTLSPNDAKAVSFTE